MKVLVAYETKYGSTKGIAERIGEAIAETGLQTDVVDISKVGPLEGYDAFVIGSAAYIGGWLKEASDFVRRNAGLLSTRPVWLFSSGPIGTETKDAQGRDVREAAAPKEFVEFRETVHPRDEHVFWGSFDHTRLSIGHKVAYAMPAVKKLLPEGDFRDWAEIDGWAKSIADSLIATEAVSV